MSKCEDTIIEKEKDVCYLKCNVHELKTHFNEKDEEVDALKVKNRDIANEMKLLKDQNQNSIMRLEKEIEVLTLKNQLLENKVDLLGNQIVESKKLFEGKQAEVKSLQSQVEEVKNKLIKDLNSSQKSTKYMEGQLSKKLELNNSTTDTEIKKLKDNVKNLVTRSHVDKVFNNKADEINKLSARVTKSEKTIEDNFNALNDEINRQTENVNSLKVCQEGIDDCAMEKVNNLEGHVTNIENLLFSGISKGSNKIVLKWKLQNYQHYFDLGERVYSPIFYTQIKGYCFKMWVDWIGNNKEILRFYLRLCRGSNYDKELEPFNMIFSLGMVDNKGVTKLKDVSLSEINKLREDGFTLSPGENECEKGCGFDFLDSSLMNNYISNDMLTMKCILTPLQ